MKSRIPVQESLLTFRIASSTRSSRPNRREAVRSWVSIPAIRSSSTSMAVASPSVLNPDRPPSACRSPWRWRKRTDRSASPETDWSCLRLKEADLQNSLSEPIMRILASIFLAAVLITGCSSDSDNGSIVGPITDIEENGGGGSDMQVSFATQVLPIFSSSCSGSGCHNPGAASGVSLASWSSTISTQGSQYGGAIVLAGNAAGSPLIDKLGSSPRFGSRMPLGRGALSSSQVQIITDWINQGALNN